jgi:hypothetical protein
VEGPRIKGKLIGNAADWQLTRPDGVTVADAIYALETDDGVIIQIRNRGLRHGPPEVMARRRRARRWTRPPTISALSPNSSPLKAPTTG